MREWLKGYKRYICFNTITKLYEVFDRGHYFIGEEKTKKEAIERLRYYLNM